MRVPSIAFLFASISVYSGHLVSVSAGAGAGVEQTQAKNNVHDQNDRMMNLMKIALLQHEREREHESNERRNMSYFPSSRNNKFHTHTTVVSSAGAGARRRIDEDNFGDDFFLNESSVRFESCAYLNMPPSPSPSPSNAEEVVDVLSQRTTLGNFFVTFETCPTDSRES